MKPDRAERLLLAGARLVLTHTEEGESWSIDGGMVPAHQAAALIRDFRLVAAPDALIAGELPQSWGMAE